MKILLDTNVLLDIALERQPFVGQAEALLSLAGRRGIEIFLSATTITDLYYIIRKAHGRETALSFVRDLLQFADVAAVDRNVILRALKADMPDFEDAVQAGSAQQEGIEIVVTRNPDDFRSSGVEVHTPKTFVSAYS